MESKLPPDEDFYKESRYLTGKVGIRPLNKDGLDNYVSKDSFNYHFLQKMNGTLLQEYLKEHGKQEQNVPQDNTVNVNKEEVPEQKESGEQNVVAKDKKGNKKRKGGSVGKKKWQPKQAYMVRKASPKGRDKKEIEEMDKPKKKDVHKLEKFFKNEDVNRSPKIVTIHV